MFPRFRYSSILLVVVSLAGLLGGCGQMPGKGPEHSDALIIDPADPCAPQRTQFNDQRNYFTDQILKSAGLGALAGAVTGGAIAGASGGNVVTGLLIGGIGGAIAGTTAGYYQNMAQKYQDQQALAQGINNDLATERAHMDVVTRSFDDVRRCRFAEARRIKLAVRGHKLDRTAAIPQLEYQHDRFNEELALAHKLEINMQKRDDEFQSAADKMRADAKNAQTQANAQASLAASKTIPEKRGSYENSIGKAEAESQVAFDVDTAPPKAT